MSAKYSPIIAIIFILLAFSISNAEINAAFNFGGGYNGNIFRDSLATEDSYSTIGGHIDYYPSSSVQVSAFGQYNAYKTNNDLSNIFGGGSLKLIPTGEYSPVSIILGGEISFQEFGEYYRLYNQAGFIGDAKIIYRSLERN